MQTNRRESKMDDSKIDASENLNDIEWKVAAFWLALIGFLVGFWSVVAWFVMSIF